MNFNDRLSVAYKVWDQPNAVDAPPSHERFSLLFLHGSQMLKEIWTYYAELAFKQWGSKLDKVVALDAVTHGDSALLNATKVTAWSGWGDFGRDAGLVLDDLAKLGELDGPVIAVGHSMGGAGALFLGSFHSGKIDGLVLMDPVWGGHWPEGDSEPARDGTRLIGQMFKKVHANSRDKFDSQEEYEKFMKTRFITRKFHPRIQHDMVQSHVYTDIDGVVRAKASRPLQSGAYMSASSIMSAANTIFRWTPIPALVLRGDVEDWNPPGDMERLAEWMPKADLKVVSGGGHLVFFERPDATFDAMKDFIDARVQDSLERRKTYQVSTEIGEYTHAQVAKELKYMADVGLRTKFSKL